MTLPQFRTIQQFAAAIALTITLNIEYFNRFKPRNSGTWRTKTFTTDKPSRNSSDDARKIP